MNFAAGYVTYFADTFKFVPGLSLFTLAALLLFLDYLKTQTHNLDKTSNVPVILLLAGIHLFFTIFPSIFWHNGYNEILLIGLNISVFAVLVFLIYLIRDWKSIYIIAGIIAFITFILSLLGILEFLGFIFLQLNPTEVIATTFNNPNLYSGILLLVLPVTYALVFVVRRRSIKILLIIISLLGFSNLVIAQSRSTLIAHFFILFIFFLFIAKEKKRKYLPFIFGGVFLTIFVLGLIFHPSLFNKFKATLNFHDSRLLSYGLAVKMWLHSPLTFIFGNGIGSFKPLYFSYRPAYYLSFTSVKAWDAVHNEFLELLVDGGLVSLIAFFILCVYIIKRGVWVFRNREISFSKRIISLSFLLSFIALLLDGLFSTNLRVSYILFFFYIIIGLIQRSSVLSVGSFNLPSITVNRKILTVLLVGGLIILTGANICYWREFLTGNLLLKSATEKISFKEKEKLLKTAITLTPWNVYPHYFLVNNYLQTRQFEKVYEEAFYVNKIIRDFSNIHFLNGAAYFSMGKYKEAERNFEYFLSTDQYNQKAEIYLIFTEYFLGNYQKMNNVLKELTEGDLRAIQKIYLPDFVFPVKRAERDIESFFMDSPNSIDLVFFRFYTLLGNIYYEGGLESLAVKYFSNAYNSGRGFFNLSTGYLVDKKLETLSKDDHNYLFAADKLQKLLWRNILEQKTNNNKIAEANSIAGYLHYFENEELKDRLKSLYTVSFRYKNYRRLMIGK